MHGVVIGLHVNPEGGVPKHPVPTLEVERNGCVGDKQNDRKHHGGPQKAVCLLEQHVLEHLKRMGHPIAPGTTGENILVDGTAPGQFIVGARLSIGEVELTITGDAPPCKTIRASFAEGTFNELSHRKTPGQTRWYAKVDQTGTVRMGDALVFLSEAEPTGSP